MYWKVGWLMFELRHRITYILSCMEMLFHGTHEVTVDSVMEMMLSARGDVPVTFKHLSALQAFTKWALDEQEFRMRSYIQRRMCERANNKHDYQHINLAL